MAETVRKVSVVSSLRDFVSRLVGESGADTGRIFPLHRERTIQPDDGGDFLARLGQLSPCTQRVLLLLGCALLFFAWWVRVPITELDEALYADVARQMVTTHQLIIPQFNYTPFYDKPVLTYWLQAISMKLFGLHEIAFRLPSALLAIALVLIMHGFVLRWLPALSTDPLVRIQAKGIAFLGGAALLLMPYIAVWAQAGTMDIPTTFFTSAALLALLEADLLRQTDATPARQRAIRWRYLLAAIFAGLAVLTKGPVGLIIPLLIWGGYHLLQRDLKAELARVPWARAALLFLLIATPWYLATYLVDGPHFITTFLFKENLARFASSARENHGLNNRFASLFVYLPVATFFTFPFSAFLLREFLLPATRISAQTVGAVLPRLRRFALVWILTIIGIFSLSRTQLPNYIQAIAGGVALLFAVHVVGRMAAPAAASPRRAAWARGLETGVLSLFGLLYTAAPVYILGFHRFSEARFGPTALPHPTAEIILGLTVGVGLLFQFNIWQQTIRRNDARLLGRALLLWAPLCACFLLTATYYTYGAYQNTALAGEFLRAQPAADEVVVYYPHHPESLVFYAERKIAYINNPHDTNDAPLAPEVIEQIRLAQTAGHNILLLTDDAGLQQVQRFAPAQLLRRFGSGLVARVSANRN